MMSQSKKRSRQPKHSSSKNLKRWWGFAALAILVVVIGFVVLRQVSGSANRNSSVGSDAISYPLEVSPAEAAAKRDAGAFVLDVRSDAEWNDFHIPGSTLIPLETLPNHLNELPHNKEIIVVCRTGVRSANGRDILRGAGFTQVASLTGGLTQWKAQGYPTVSGQS
jgi:rhodanese-related sulfurtransferase